MPKVSVIVPVYNVEDYLGQCLDSILMQTLEDIEVICVDDGSTDGSSNILDTYAFLDSRLNIIHQENKGPGAARNRGLKEASGEFIIFLDSDDFFEPNMLEKMVEQAEKDDSDVVVCGFYNFDNNIKQTVKRIAINEKFLKKSPTTPEDLGKNLLSVCNMLAQNKLIRKKLIQDFDLSYDEYAKYSEDLCMSAFALMCAKKITLLEDCFAYYRINTNTSLTSDKVENLKDCLTVFNRIDEKLKKLNLQDKFEEPLIVFMRSVFPWILKDCPADKKKKNLILIKEILKSDLFEKIFFCPYARVSIIIPVYNAAEFLPECLDSCLNQTLKEIEIICVDDGSTDNSLEILNQYAQKDKRITVLQQENQRQAIARNKALEVANGRFIQFLDADDYLEPDACECLYLYSEIFGLDMCQCTAIEFYNHNKKEFENPYHCLTWLSDNFYPVFNHEIIPNVLPHMAVTAWLTFYRHHFLVQKNITWINKKIAYEDTLFFTEAILKAKRVGALKASCYHRRVHSNATTQQMTNNFNDYMEILQDTLSLIQKEDKNFLKLYSDVFLQKAWGIFAQFDPNDKTKMAQYLYHFVYHLQKNYHFVLPSDVYAWCLRYLNYSKASKKEKLKFKYFSVLAKCLSNEYKITLIKLTISPEFMFSVLDIPVFQIQKILVPVKYEEQPIKKDIYKITDVYYKLLGLTFLKIRIKDLYE